ncbi:MAG: hypothetical protein ABFS37_04650 [Acidobacteriota bacterium]
MDLSSLIIGLEGDLRMLITQWDRFFSGELRVPPNREKNILGQRLRALSEKSSGESSGDRFRLDQLQHRFMTYAVNWERLLREREEGVRRFIPGKGHEVGASVSSGSQSPVPNVRPVASVDRDDTGDLFERWCRVKAEIGQDVKIERHAFEAQIDRQRRDIEARMGAKVEFEITVADGKVKVTARRTDKKNEEE